MRIRDRIIWITGASSGIGEALAYELSQNGAKLILSARNAEKLEKVKSQCLNPQQHQVIPLDLADVETINGAVTPVLREITQIDILIHCGGVSQRALVQDTALSVDYQIMAINYFGAIALFKQSDAQRYKSNPHDLYATKRGQVVRWYCKSSGRLIFADCEFARLR